MLVVTDFDDALEEGAMINFVTVQQGQITFQQSDCSTRTYTAGQSFVEGGADNIGRAQNTGTTQTTVFVLFVTPVGSPMTFPVTGPDCP